MNHIRRALTYWYTFGYPEINSPHYIRRLACDNLDMVRRCCMFCQLFLMVMCITRLALVGCEWINLWPFVIASVIVTIILVINNRLDDTKNVLFHSYAQTAVFSVTLVVLAGFYDFIAAPGSIAVMTCMALLCVGSLFDSRPIDNLIAYAIGLAALYAIALAESGPSLVSNLFNMAVSVLLGLCISWYKSRSHFGQLLANDKELKALQHAARVQIMVSQINPHFVCNVLATIRPCATRMWTKPKRRSACSPHTCATIRTPWPERNRSRSQWNCSMSNGTSRWNRCGSATNSP